MRSQPLFADPCDSESESEVGLSAQLVAQPQSAKQRQRHHQHNQARRQADVAIGISEVHRVVSAHVPHQQRKDGKARGQEKREERRRKRQQQSREQSESPQRESQNLSATRALGFRGMHHLHGLSRLEYSSMASSAQIELWQAEKGSEEHTS